MRILLTNTTLADRSGSELYVRDLAIALRRRGHEPIAYSPHLGDVADDLRDATVAVTNDLRTIRVAPDVIHGQHHLEMMTALAHFERVPAIYVCHGWLPWQEAPPRHPRIRRYVAVDAVVHDRLVYESGIDPALTRVVLNFVDLQRFVRRDPLPPKPRRALVFNGHATEENFGAVVREACARRGIDVDIVGQGVQRLVREPEKLLPQHDLVFARARSALEALAVGCAVIVADPRGVAGMVTTTNFDELRKNNFGIRTLSRSLASLGQEIDAYDPNEAARVCDRVRAEADLESVVATYEQIYESVINEEPSIESERDAFVDYLRWLSLQTKLPGFSEWNRIKRERDDALLAADALRNGNRAEPSIARDLQSANEEAEEIERRYRSDIASLRRRFDRLYGPRWFVRAAAMLRRR
jgi:glycosyltransferase involved in cell wall biosynthesis